ncbi:hypothetical protein BZZ01_02635 [Nostocales cyanobacterium HT-58-2]|nr:hypothetical protein BZZ01_02635 [Nostocales cyanobacterium HT-58-2]
MIQHLKKSIQRHPFTWFYVTSVLIEILVMMVLFLTDGEAKLVAVLERSGRPLKTDYVSTLQLVFAEPSILPVMLLLVLQPLTPTIAAFTITAIAFKQQGMKHLLGRYRFWSDEVGWQSGWKVWVLCLTTFVGMSLATAGLNRWLLSSNNFSWNINILSTSFLFSLLIAMFLDGGGVTEETGWRGFALPFLQQRMSPLSATLLLGILWSLWHIPAKPDLLTSGFAYFLLFFGVFTIRLTALSVVMTYFYNRVGGSTLIAIAMHGLHNDSVGLMGSPLSESDRTFLITEITLLIPILVSACIFLVISKGRLGKNT